YRPWPRCWPSWPRPAASPRGQRRATPMAEHEPPPSLADLQHRFQGYVLGGSPGIGDAVVADDDASRARRLAIYADGYALRLDEALRADYRGLHAMLGDG